MIAKPTLSFKTLFIAAIAISIGWAVLSAFAPQAGTPYEDQRDYHEPTIRQFRADFPRLNLSDYGAASTPGYHITLAAGQLLFGTGDTALRVGNVLFSTAFLLSVWWICHSIKRWSWLLAIPLLLSPYVNYSALWLRPDNAGWLFVFLIVGLALRRSFGPRHMLLGALLLLMLVWVRQAHIWCAAVLWASAYVGENGDWRPTRRRLIHLALMGLLTLPAFGVVIWFFQLWGGMVPPRFQTVPGQLPTGHSGWQHEGPNLSVPMFILALCGSVLLLYLPLLWKLLRRTPAARKSALLGAMIAAPAALLVGSTWDEQHGRWSGLWNVAKQLPAPGQRSVLLVPLALLGGTLLGWLLASLPARPRWILLITLLAFIAAQTTNAMAWQKYYEPFVIAFIAIAAAILYARPAEAENPGII